MVFLRCLVLILSAGCLCTGEAMGFRSAYEPLASKALLVSQASTFAQDLSLDSVERRDQELCETELEAVEACVMDDSCLQCVEVAYNAVLATTNPLCIDIVNGICPAIESGCPCGDCVSQLETYYTCRVSCLEVDCSKPCSAELGTAVACIPSASQEDCLKCVDTSIKDILATTGSDCGPLTDGICTAISPGGCECGECFTELNGYYDCIFETDLQDNCPQGLGCNEEPGTLAQVVSEDPELTSLLAAGGAAGLAEDLNDPTIDITCFAPVDAAFEAVDEKFLEEQWVEHLSAILLTHLFEGTKTAEEFEDGQEYETLSGETLTVSVTEQDMSREIVVSTGGTPASTVQDVDIDASNGIIHKLDTVLIPTWKDLITTANEAGNFTILLELLDMTDLASEIPEDGGSTIFAPTDEAFNQLPPETLEFYRDSSNKDALTALLSGHLAEKVYPSRTIQDGGAIPTMGGTRITTTVQQGDGEAEATFLLNGDVEMTPTNVLANNGIIQVISKVLTPGTLAEVVSRDPELTSLLGAGLATELAEGLNDPTIDITCFAPVDAAFAAVDQKFLEDPWVEHLAAILLTHLFDGTKTAEEFEDGDEYTTLSGETLTVSVTMQDDNSTKIVVATGGTPASTVQDVDIDASNGIIHKLDTVLVPTWKDLITTANDIGNFTILLELLDMTELATEVPADGATGFLPTDEAFNQLPPETLEFYRDPANNRALTALLSGHFAEEVVPSRSIQDGGTIPTLGGTRITTTVQQGTGDAEATFLLNGEVQVEQANVLASNGIIHAIAQVLTPGTLAEVVASDPELTSLLGAGLAAGLAEDLNDPTIDITCFAPVDAAFAAVDEKFLKEEWVEHLSAILLTHLFEGTKAAEEFVDGEEYTTLSGETLTVSVTEQDASTEIVVSTGGTPASTVQDVDIDASNGIIHKLDTVLIPTWKDLINTAGDVGEFSILLELLDLTELASAIPRDGGSTFFAPTDEAFNQLPQETLEFYRDPTNSNALTALLSGHFASKVYPSRTIQDGGSIPTIGGTTITTSVQQDPGTAEATFLLNDNVQVEQANVLASNGILHAINQVLPTAIPTNAPVTEPGSSSAATMCTSLAALVSTLVMAAVMA